MPQITVRSSNSRINKAGNVISSAQFTASGPDEQLLNEAFAVLSDWRTLHAHPLNSIATTLRRRCSAVADEPLVAQRLKRFISIREKLLRTPEMALARMQDIAGCRAVLPSIDDVYILKRRYEDHARKFPERGPQLLAEATKDYILEPKEDGYRSIHMVMRYRTTNSAAAVSNGLRTEIQIRSRLQHAWAMAVETVSSATAQSLKAGRGRQEWKQFFRLMANVIALKENMPIIAGTDELNIYPGIRQLAMELRVVPLLETIRPALEQVTSSEQVKAGHPDDLYLMELDAEKNEVMYRLFSRRDYLEAGHAYAGAERRHVGNPNVHVVLVSVKDSLSLRSAYPSYFMEMSEFITLIKEAIAFGTPHTPIDVADRAGWLFDIADQDGSA